MEGSRFDSGVYGYVVGRCEVVVYFPIDSRGNPEIACKHCPFYRFNSLTCGLNERKVPWGEKFTGPWCPLRREEVIDALPGDDE